MENVEFFKGDMIHHYKSGKLVLVQVINKVSSRLLWLNGDKISKKEVLSWLESENILTLER